MGSNILKENLGNYHDRLNDFFIAIYEDYKNEKYFKIVISSSHCQRMLNLWLHSDDSQVSDGVKDFFRINSMTQGELADSIPGIVAEYKKE